MILSIKKKSGEVLRLNVINILKLMYWFTVGILIFIGIFTGGAIWALS